MLFDDTDQTDEDRFVNAAFDGDFAMVQAFLDAGGDIDVAPRGWNALHAAVENQQIEMINYLLQRGADPNKLCNQCRPLHHAIDIEADTAAQSGEPDEPIDFVVTPILIEAGADVNAPDADGRTPLQWAKDSGHQAAIDLLRKHGAVE